MLKVLAMLATRAASSPVSSMNKCPESVVHLEFGRSGVIPCHFQSPLVTWGNGTLNKDGTKVPLVYISDYTYRSGSCYESGEYDILTDGSLVINSVEIHHQITFEVVVRKKDSSGTDINCYVDVQVYARPVPDHPVLNGHNQQYIEMKAERKDVLNCTVTNVRPAVTLEFVAHNISQEGLLLQNSSVTLDNGDGTFNVSLRVEYEVLRASLEQMVLACRVTESQLFPKETRIRINLPPVPMPVIENCGASDVGCEVALRKTGTLSCRVHGMLSSDLRLTWETLEGQTGLQIDQSSPTTSPCLDGGSSCTRITGTYNVLKENVTVGIHCSIKSKDNKSLSSSRIAYLRYQEPEGVVQTEDKGVSKDVFITVTVFLVVLIVVVCLFGFVIIRKLDKLPKKNQGHGLDEDTQQDGEPSAETPLNGVGEQVGQVLNNKGTGVVMANGGGNQQQSIP